VIAPSFDHLLRLSDGTGLLEHARGASPRRSSGYCVDDNARGLLVITREPSPPSPVARLAERCLALVTDAQLSDGRFHNRLSYDRRWTDEPGLGDWWGRAMWGLGTAAAHHPDEWVREEATRCFEISAGCRSGFLRSMVFAILGGAELLSVEPGHTAARDLVEAGVRSIVVARAARPLGGSASDGWPWPELRLGYANAAVPEAMIAAGVVLGDDGLVSEGLDLLRWLMAAQTNGDHLSMTPVAGWVTGEPRPAFDQQPIEVSTLADACARALTVTGDQAWATGVGRCIDWFLGVNDARTAMHDPATGGGYDGLTADGCNINQGAESTLAWISTLQHGRPQREGLEPGSLGRPRALPMPTT